MRSPHTEHKPAAFKIDRQTLDNLYKKYNDKKYIHPDPLEFLYNYTGSEDIEAAGFIASILAYGNIKQILKSVSFVLDRLGESPAAFLKEADTESLERLFSGFKHRFTTSSELAGVLHSVGQVLKKYGTLNECFLRGFKRDDGQLLPAILFFIRELRPGDCTCYNSLLPMPNGKCAYKRINLYLRWMVRKDNIDPGIWHGIPADRLVIPLDVHMHRIAKKFGLTTRNPADFKTAADITESLKNFDGLDPVKYDFCLTRQGIHGSFF